MSVDVIYEATPNPDSMKFVVTQQICEQSLQYDEPSATQNSPLASKIFGFPWAAGVMIGPNFVTVTKQDWVDWDILADPLSNLIKEHIENNEPVYLEIEKTASDILDDDDDIVVKIKTILNNEIRPMVAMDGGDIVFSRYEDNTVYVHMKGACVGCPSATATLKQGVEARLMQALPEIKEVVSL